jgi:hypothetical protein
MRRLALILFLAFVSEGFLAAQTLPSQERQAAEKLIQALTVGDKAAVAKMINYPLNRQQPLPPIRNEKEFIENYSDFFDSDTIRQIQASEKDMSYSWRGLSIGPGLVWVDGGKVRAITIATARQMAAAQAAKKQMQASLHPSARTYDRVLFSCKTKNYQIRIHADAGGSLFFVESESAVIGKTRPCPHWRGTSRWERREYDFHFQEWRFPLRRRANSNLRRQL